MFLGNKDTLKWACKNENETIVKYFIVMVQMFREIKLLYIVHVPMDMKGL